MLAGPMNTCRGTSKALLDVAIGVYMGEKQRRECWEQDAPDATGHCMEGGQLNGHLKGHMNNVAEWKHPEG